jgi:hypothetical protein
MHPLIVLGIARKSIASGTRAYAKTFHLEFFAWNFFLLFVGFWKVYPLFFNHPWSSMLS